MVPGRRVRQTVQFEHLVHSFREASCSTFPFLWFYEIGNALLVAHRRKRITFDQIESFLTRLLALPIVTEGETASEVFELPKLAQRLHLTNYDAAYLALALRLGVPLATTDLELRRAAPQLSVQIFVP